MKDDKKYVGEGRIDFHLHTTNSDGNDTPEEVIKLAVREGLRIIALTDHNKFSIVKPVTVEKADTVSNEQNSILVLPGCEFSASYLVPEWNEATEIHIIGLFPNGVDPNDFEEIFEGIDEGKKIYVRAILEQLEERGIYISQDEVDEASIRAGHTGRHQIADVLVSKGYAKSVDDAFDRHIGNFSEYYIPATKYIKYASLDKVVRQIRMSNGIPVLAHPYAYAMNESEMETLIADFKSLARDVAAMEVYYELYINNAERMAFLKKMADKYGLLESVASDRHRDGQPFASTDKVGLFDKMKQILYDSKYFG